MEVCYVSKHVMRCVVCFRWWLVLQDVIVTVAVLISDNLVSKTTLKTGNTLCNVILMNVLVKY